MTKNTDSIKTKKMDLSNNKPVIINASVGGGWYPRGTDRLVKSLNFHGWGGDVKTWKNKWPNDNYDKSCPYTVKAAAIEETLKENYDHILWLDCSVWAIKDPMIVFDVIHTEGYYFWMSGFNCAQTCSDKCLEYFGVSRDEAEGITEVSSSMFGLNLKTDVGRQFVEMFIQAAKDGAFHGSREHDGQSSDPRFLFHRQDQSVASLIAHKLGFKITPPNIYSAYYHGGKPYERDVVFLMRGL